ncbi:BamA/TamA family outer membrane protein [Flavobacterium sangjuense]|uniref:Outer membrane protein assembly factor BamA n=1 Tax=Flavobacterium sangjuense TaxID=2518177 RepID=A0A4P7PSU3_9FLAO|nr:hypothetical protein [Flavobacterium sangjuense]QBZ98001.1 hypothetical protein GS03_01501 [Flavobacterium sangjuense]
MKFKYLSFFLFLLFTCQISQAQEKNSGNDSVTVYKNIEKLSKKNKLNKFVYRLLFKSKRSSAAAKKNSRKRFFIKKSFDRSEGKIIRDIRIETLDPFGYAVDNYKDQPEKGFEKFGNALHMKTKNWTIRNLLLFKKNEPLDSLVAKESERLIRKQRYVRSVIIKPIEIPNSKDSVDISVRVLDSWSLIPTGAVSSSKGNFDLTERNFVGLGHEIENNFSRRFDDGKKAYEARYTINNIKNTYIKTTFAYENDLYDNVTRSARIERQFFSPLTRLAGGAYYENRFYVDSLPDATGTFANQTFKLQTQQYWFGHSFKIFGGKSEDFRTTNLVTTFGYKNVAYSKKPTLQYDPSKFFASEKLYLATIGLNTQKFAEEKYLFNFGIIEDVPYGQVYAITGGFQDKNNNQRAYFSGRFAYGHYFNFGYLGTNIEWGSFNKNGHSEETTLRIEANYFTNLLSLGSWKIRQFIKPTLVLGNHRASIIKDRVTISNENGISGFDNPLLNGTKKLFASFQTQTYLPGNWHGFHFSPFFNMTLGLLGDDTNRFFNDKVYSIFSLGALINNDYLVFNSFQISFSFYPSIPYQGSNLFKTNTFKNNDLSLPDFQIGEPTIVPYN